MGEVTTLEVDRRLEVTVTSEGTRMWCTAWYHRGILIGQTAWASNPMRAHRDGDREERDYRTVLARPAGSAAA